MSDDELPIGAHDEYLAHYSLTNVQVWCSNPKCELHSTGVTVDLESEYGQRSRIPEECWICHSDWLDDQPEAEEDEDDVREVRQAD